MKTINLSGIMMLESAEAAAPMISRTGDVLLRVDCVGLCGSDVHYYKTGRIGSQIVKYPFRVGHEFSGTVVETGAGVGHLKAGMRVAVDPAISCGDCDQCRAGRHHTCRNLLFLGCPGQVEGCLCEYIVMPGECCFPVDPHVSPEQAAIAEPFAIGVYAVKLAGMAMSGAAIGILGSGPVGLCVMLAARAAGCGRIYMTDKIDSRVGAALRHGASWAGNPDRTDICGEISMAEPGLLDVVFECCGSQEALDQAVGLLKPGGKLMIVGIPEVDRIAFAIDKLRRSELCIQNVRRQNGCMGLAVKMISEGQVDVSFMITHKYGIADAGKAFELVAGYNDGVIKAFVMP